MFSPEKLIPHQPPARLLSTIIAIGDGEAEVEIEALNRDESPFVLIEAAAQAVAAGLGKRDADKGNPPSEGYLVGIRNVTFEISVDKSVKSNVKVKLFRDLNPFYIYDMMITQKNVMVVQGSVTLYKKEL